MAPKRLFSSYISERDAVHLRQHKYAGVDNSLLSRYVLQRYWNWLVELVPLWVAPNLLTLTGFFFILFNFGLMWWILPDFESAGPNWLYLCMAAGLFAYQSLDSIDGKQARRTGTSSPLGELFDHGCDALNTGIGAIMGVQTMAMGASWWSIAVMCAMMANFYCSTWETYHTGALYLSHFSGPVEGILTSVLAFLGSGLFGQQFYKTPLCDLWSPLPCSIPLNLVAAFFAVFVSVYNVAAALINVSRTFGAKVGPQAKPPPHSSAAFKDMTPAPALTMVPLVAFIVLLSVWVAATPTMFSHLFVPFCLGLSVAFGYIVGLIVLAHCCKAAFPLANPLLVATALGTIGAVAVNVGAVKVAGWSRDELHAALVWIYLAATVAVYGHFALDVIARMKTIFNIWCLRIKPKQGPRPGELARGLSGRKASGRKIVPPR